MTKRRSTSTLFASAAVIALIALAGCGSSHTSASTAARSTAPATTAPPAPPTVAVGNSGLGSILVDSQGRTVYMFGADSGTTSACTGACAAAWPPVQATGGYVLNRSPADISVLQIVEAIDGEIRGDIPGPWEGNPEKDIKPNPVAEREMKSRCLT